MNLIDLSYPISNNMTTYPTDPDVTIRMEKNIKTHHSLLHSFSMGTHTGTHLDAPAHVIKNGKTLDEIDLNHFIGRAIMIDKDSYYKLENFDENIDGVIFNTGWYNYFQNPDIFYGSGRPEIPNDLIEMCLELDIRFFGCDLPSVDQSGSIKKPIHNSLLGYNIVIYEKLTNLGEIPSLSCFKFIGFPLSLSGLDGSPVRAVAII